MNTKALIITIGTSPKAASGIVFSIRQQNPSHIYFIVTPESKKSIEIIKNQLKTTKSFKFEEFDLDETNDVEKIFLFCTKKNRTSLIRV